MGKYLDAYRRKTLAALKQEYDMLLDLEWTGPLGICKACNAHGAKRHFKGCKFLSNLQEVGRKIDALNKLLKIFPPCICTCHIKHGEPIPDSVIEMKILFSDQLIFLCEKCLVSRLEDFKRRNEIIASDAVEECKSKMLN